MLVLVATLAVGAVSSKTCGTWCEDNGHAIDACDCGVCGSFGLCTFSCNEGGDRVECPTVPTPAPRPVPTPTPTPTPTPPGGYKVLTIGDSWGDTGPTYKIIADVFKKHGVPVNSKNRAIGGTTACGWAAKTKSDKSSTRFARGQSLVNAAVEEFGEAGPDFVWYTLGGNDLSNDKAYAACLGRAKTEKAAQNCVKASSDKAKACTVSLLKPFFAKFPKAKLMQNNYDVACESPLCESTIVANYLGGKYCNGDKLCQNKLGLYWYSVYVQELQKQFPRPQYTGLNIFGTVQQANGIPGASPGNPVLDRDSGDCGITHEILCIHPAYGTKMATALGDEYWRSFFSTYVSMSGNSTIV